MRFAMHIDRWWAPFLLLGGAAQSNSFVELTPDSLNLRFGVIFHDEVPRRRSSARASAPGRSGTASAGGWGRWAGWG